MSSNAPNLPSLNSAQVRELDRLSSERFGVPIDWLMEAAGWQVARHCRGRVAVLAGTGNNGGDGLAAARHLHRWGRLHSVACLEPAGLEGLPAEQAAALARAGVEIDPEPRLDGATLVVDAIFGTGLSRAPEGRAKEWIESINGAGLKVVAVDVPSGLDSDAGSTPGLAVKATQTLTLGLPKRGLLSARGPELAGEVWIADIGIPAKAFEELGIEVPKHLFSMHDRVQLEALRL